MTPLDSAESGRRSLVAREGQLSGRPIRALRSGLREYSWLLLPVVLGVAIRLAFLWQTGGLEPWRDEARYIYLAVAWERFGLYLGSTHWLWPPAFPAYLALFLPRFQDAGLEIAKLGQVLLSAVVGTTVVLLARRVFSPRAAFVAGLIWAVYLPLIGFTHLLWPETLLLAVLLPAFYIYLSGLTSEDPGSSSAVRFAIAGLLLGVACLLKQVVLPIPVFFSLAVLFDRRQGVLPRRSASAAILLLATAAVVLPWSLRNYEVYGRRVVSGSTLGVNAWVGVNGVYVNYDYPFRDLRRYQSTLPVYRWLLNPPANAVWQRSEAANLIDRSSENALRGLEFVARHPGYYLRTRVKKLADWASPYSFFIRHFRNRVYTSPLTDDGIRQPLVLFSLASSALVLASAVPGLLWSLADRTRRRPFILAILALLAPVCITSMSRFRAPIEPLLIVLASGFLTGANRPWLKSRFTAFSVYVGWLLLAALWAINSHEILLQLRHIL